MISKKQNEVNVLTCQLVSQLMYQNSRVITEDTNKVIKEILALTCTYRKKIKNLSK